MDSAVFWGNCCNNCYNCYNHCNCDCNCNCKCNCHMCDDSEGKVPSSKKPSISNLKVFIGMNNDLLPINRVIKEGEYSPVKLTFDITNLKYVQPNSLTLLKPNGDYVYDLPVESPLMLNNDVFNYTYDFPYKWKLWISDLNGDRYSTEFLFQKGQTNVLLTLKARPDTSDIFFDGVQQITKKEDGWVIATREYPVDSEVKWSVQKRDYITQTGTVVLDEDKEVIVDLIEDKLELILDIRPKNAKVWINDELYSYDTHVTDKDYFWYRMDMPRDTNIVWKVEAHGYIPEIGEFTLNDNRVLNVILTPVPKEYYLTFNVIPRDAVVTVNGEEYTYTRNFLEGTTINYEVTAEGYNSQSGTFVLLEDTTKNITLDRIQLENHFTLTVLSDPSDATITIDGEEINRVYKPANTVVNISISKPGYYNRDITYMITKDETITFSIFKEGEGVLTFDYGDILKLQYSWNKEDGRDLDTSTNAELISDEWVGFGDSTQVKNLLYFGGDNMLSGAETIMINNRALSQEENVPKIVQYNIFANYYGTLRSGKATVTLTSYDKGLIYMAYTFKIDSKYYSFDKDGYLNFEPSDGSKYVLQKYIRYVENGETKFIPVNSDLSVPSDFTSIFNVKIKRTVLLMSLITQDGKKLSVPGNPGKYYTIINDTINTSEFNETEQTTLNYTDIWHIDYTVDCTNDGVTDIVVVDLLRKENETQPISIYADTPAVRRYDFDVVGSEETFIASADILVKTNNSKPARKGGTNVGSIYYNRETRKAELVVYDDVMI